MADQSANERALTYWDYIKLDELLSLQQPRTAAHDEIQFIVVHQTFELWFRLAIHELRGALEALAKNDLQQGAHLLKRVAVILRTSLNGFDPLMTMTMQGYAEFRDALHPASGFQSSQFRILEILLGIERVTSKEDQAKERFYWEAAVQTGETFTNFMAKYQEQLLEDYETAKEQNLRRTMLRLTETATGLQGVAAYRHIFANRDEHPLLLSLAESARDLQQAVMDFRLSHHKVTVFTIGAHAAGTSDSHKDPVPSCAHYLANVIREHSEIFPELEEAITN
ncbi:MAG TPA: tryptophan 2,3-dioxygenase family protein [Candidatus Kapabacteria bacterium]|nr:tryptophan 2,3-dioxygenase family protein [Candidatus Kapabacteria bacterium]